MDDAQAKRLDQAGAWRGRQLMETPLVPGRECDGCDVCCVALSIDDPELTKVHGVRCDHLIGGVGCSIYATRPLTCRRFNCGWKMMRWVHPDLRPDKSGALIRLHVVTTGAKEADLEVIVTLLNAAALEAPGLAETIAAAVHAGRGVHLEAADKPGEKVGRVQLNDGLLEPVLAQDRRELTRRLGIAYRQALALGRGKPPRK